jgi:arylformamidase
MRWYDVSMPIGPSTPSFPGDPPVVVHPLGTAGADGGYAVSSLAMGSHSGTHVDPPAHFFPGGRTVDHLDLDSMNGPCHVVALPPGRTSVGPTEIDRVLLGTKRVLLKTPNSARWTRSMEYFPDFVALNEEGAARASERGLVLVGIDALSVERSTGGRYPVHRRLLERGTVLLEGLLLDGVEEGPYELRCLPLRLAEGDGAPARAVLLAR